MHLVAQIPSKTSIPFLRQKMSKIISQYGFQVFLNDKCNGILENDTLSLLRQLNQDQRRAIKVDPQIRCSICARPLYLTAAPSSIRSRGADIHNLGTDAKIWGPTSFLSLPDSAIVFSNKVALHKICFDTISQNKR